LFVAKSVYHPTSIHVFGAKRVALRRASTSEIGSRR
jgi:hypothetical protein